MDESLKTVEMTAARLDLNGDGREDWCVSFASYILWGNAGGAITCYRAEPGGDFTEVIAETACAPESVALSGRTTNGYVEMAFSGPGVFGLHFWTWDGSRYVPPVR